MFLSTTKGIISERKAQNEHAHTELQNYNAPPNVAPRTTNVAYMIVLKSTPKEPIAAPLCEEVGLVLEVDVDNIKLVCPPLLVVVAIVPVWLPVFEPDWLVETCEVVVVVVVTGLSEMENEGEVA